MKETNSKDLKIIPIDDEMLYTASFLAKNRMTFEFPRSGYGPYNIDDHFKNIQFGYIGELSFLYFIANHYKVKYENLTPLDRFKKLQDERFSYNFVIGQTDGGSDFEIKNLKLDVKTYGTKIIRNIEDVYKRNLLIDKRQAENHVADIYIQTFIIGNEVPKECVLAGFYKGLPELNYNFPKPAHATSVRNLKTMKTLLDSYF